MGGMVMMVVVVKVIVLFGSKTVTHGTSRVAHGAETAATTAATAAIDVAVVGDDRVDQCVEIGVCIFNELLVRVVGSIDDRSIEFSSFSQNTT